MAGLTLDAGALIAFERNDRRTVALLARSLHHRFSIVVPAGAHRGDHELAGSHDHQNLAVDRLLAGPVSIIEWKDGSKPLRCPEPMIVRDVMTDEHADA